MSEKDLGTRIVDYVLEMVDKSGSFTGKGKNKKITFTSSIISGNKVINVYDRMVEEVNKAITLSNNEYIRKNCDT